ncbi:hypothetical protein [Actinoplanes sp. HUAS TT8]|uniref:hypothetical protein n=1 Tax=Actinoplanes sp. HUAS TT8 TaxID=3447453 RepID=UPI003F51CCCA
MSIQPTLREPTQNLRDRGAANFHAALGRVLAAGLEDALAAGDHDRAINLINRGFAEGTPQIGCELLCRAIDVVGAARTWTVQLAPLSHLRQRSTGSASADQPASPN